MTRTTRTLEFRLMMLKMKKRSRTATTWLRKLRTKIARLSLRRLKLEMLLVSKDKRLKSASQALLSCVATM
jgi:hypothetical protein